MTYNNAIPQPTDLISVSQGDLLTNFSQLYTVLAQDHIELDDGTVANRGKHKQVTLPELGAGPATAASEMAIYTKDVGGTTRLFYRPPSSGTEVQMTGPLTQATNGTCLIVGGVKLVWGKGTVPSGGNNVAVTFVSAFSAAPWSIVTNEWAQTQTGATARSSGPENATVTASGFTYRVWGGIVPANVPFGYFAVGPV